MTKWTLFVCSVLVVRSALSQDTLSMNAERLQMVLDSQGKLTSLRDSIADAEYLHREQSSYLLLLKRYSEEALKPPSGMAVLSTSPSQTDVELTCDPETSIRVRVASEPGWFHIEILGGMAAAPGRLFLALQNG